VRDTHVRAVVFDLLFTLVHPGPYPGGTGRIGWLADLLGLDSRDLQARWARFEPMLESGRADTDPLGAPPELLWLTTAAAEMGVHVRASDLDLIEADWDLTHRLALLNPPQSTIDVLDSLRHRGIAIGVLSNTHALELRAWDRSPVAGLVDAVSFSHVIGVCKPDVKAYHHVLTALDVAAPHAVYVGDGTSDELSGARRAGFGMVVLAEEAPSLLAPQDLPRLRAQADRSITCLSELAMIVSE